MKSVLFILSICCSVIGAAQNKRETLETSIYLDFGGMGGYGSLNVEQQFLVKNDFRVLGFVGVSTYSVLDPNRKFNPDIIAPIGVHLTYGLLHRMEIGLGEAITSIPMVNIVTNEIQRVSALHFSASLGYRYCAENGLLFRAFYNPIFENHRRFRNWAGLSIGYTFKK